MRQSALFIVILIISMLTCGTALALSLGQNITIPDNNSSANSGWYGPQEDNEVEPGMAKHQKWDLEGFFQNGDTLSLVGGYDFANGVDNFTSGDIFIAAGGAPVYGDIHRGANGYNLVSNTYGYDFVIDLDFTDGSYEILQIDENTTLKTAYYKQNEGSSPWKYVSGGIQTGNEGLFTLFANMPELSAAATGFSGDLRFAMSGFDLSFLGHGTEFFAHFTMACGNDNLMGKGAVVPEPGTLVLLGAGFSGLFIARRWRSKK